MAVPLSLVPSVALYLPALPRGLEAEDLQATAVEAPLIVELLDYGGVFAMLHFVAVGNEPCVMLAVQPEGGWQPLFGIAENGCYESLQWPRAMACGTSYSILLRTPPAPHARPEKIAVFTGAGLWEYVRMDGPEKPAGQDGLRPAELPREDD